MKNNALFKTVPLAIALRLVIVAVLTLAYLQFSEAWLRSLGAGEWSWIVPGVLFFAALALFVKHTVLNSIAPGYDMQAMSALDFAQAHNYLVASGEPIPVPAARSNLAFHLDLPRIESLTAELQSLGFQLAREGQMLPVSANKQVTYARLFSHSSGAGASVMQIFTAQRSLDVILSVECAFEERWNWSDSNLKRNWLTFMMRRPRCLGRVHPVDTGAAELWASCSKNSAKIERELGVQRLLFDPQQYEAYMVVALVELRAAFRRKNVFIGIVEGIFLMPRSTEWWGEYAKYAKKS